VQLDLKERLEHKEQLVLSDLRELKVLLDLKERLEPKVL
jgi:hypothetical protein